MIEQVDGHAQVIDNEHEERDFNINVCHDNGELLNKFVDTYNLDESYYLHSKAPLNINEHSLEAGHRFIYWVNRDNEVILYAVSYPVNLYIIAYPEWVMERFCQK